MPAVVEFELAVSFLKFRNIDLLSQGLYYVEVSVKPDRPSTRCVSARILQSDSRLRKGQHTARAPDASEYPAAEAVPTDSGGCVRSKVIGIRYVDQVEVLDEVAVFRLRGPAAELMAEWGDGVVVNFELWHCRKEKLDKRKKGVWQRMKPGGEWEPYCKSAAAALAAAQRKGERHARIEHGGQQVAVCIAPGPAGWYEEPVGARGARLVPVRLGLDPLHRSHFKRVATRGVPLRVALLPRTEWIPVTWDNWYFGHCPVLVHTSGVLSVSCDGGLSDTAASPKAKGGARHGRQYRASDGFSDVVMADKGAGAAAAGSQQDRGGGAAEWARLLAGYAALSFYALRRAIAAFTGFRSSSSSGGVCVGARVVATGLVGSAAINGAEGSVVSQLEGGRWGVRFDDPRIGQEALRDPNLRVLQPENEPHAPPPAPPGPPAAADGSAALQGWAAEAAESQGAAGAAQGTEGAASGARAPGPAQLGDPVPSGLRAAPDRVEWCLRRRLMQDRGGRAACCAGWVTHHTFPGGVHESEVAAAQSALEARHAAEEVALRCVGASPAAVAEAVAPICAAAAHQWAQSLAPDRGPVLSPEGAALQSRGAKRVFWRAVKRSAAGLVLRGSGPLGSPLGPSAEDGWHRCGSGGQAPLLQLDGSQGSDNTLPPHLPLTFTYPKFTRVSFEPLAGPDSAGSLPPQGGSPSESPVVEAAPAEAARSQRRARPPSPSGSSSSGFASDGSQDDSQSAAPSWPPQGALRPELCAARRSLPSPKASRIRRRLSDAHSGPGAVAGPTVGGPHLIVFVHGWKGNQYDMRILQNYMAIYIPRGVEFLCAKSLEEHGGECIDSLAERLATEVADYIQVQCPHPRRLSFVGHSMGTIVIRAALHHRALAPYLPLLWTYASLSGPHLGVLRAGTQLVGHALACLSRVKTMGSIRQLRMDNPTLHTLSARDKLGLFRHCIFVASDADRFVPRPSAALDSSAVRYCQEAGGGFHGGEKSTTALDALRNITLSLSTCESVERYAVHFDPVGRRELTRRLDRAVGKSVHIAFLVDGDFVHGFLSLFRHRFV